VRRSRTRWRVELCSVFVGDVRRGSCCEETLSFLVLLIFCCHLFKTVVGKRKGKLDDLTDWIFAPKELKTLYYSIYNLLHSFLSSSSSSLQRSGIHRVRIIQNKVKSPTNRRRNHNPPKMRSPRHTSLLHISSHMRFDLVDRGLREPIRCPALCSRVHDKATAAIMVCAKVVTELVRHDTNSMLQDQVSELYVCGDRCNPAIAQRPNVSEPDTTRSQSSFRQDKRRAKITSWITDATSL
jgi:hypothetical protein